jgi:hypothetical protein
MKLISYKACESLQSDVHRWLEDDARCFLPTRAAE